MAALDIMVVTPYNWVLVSTWSRTHRKGKRLIVRSVKTYLSQRHQ
jgi:hypothetical protein